MLKTVFAVFGLLIGLVFILTGCDGANSASWSNRNLQESSSDTEFRIAANSVNGTRNRTFSLTADQLSRININSSAGSGVITLVISHDGNLDGTEIERDISDFNGIVDTDGLAAGQIRFALRFDDVRNADVVVDWR